MNAFLMHRERDFELESAEGPGQAELIQDLELTNLCEAMAGADKFVFGVAMRALLCSVADPGEILYRQNVLRDCLRNSVLIRAIYDLVVETIENQRQGAWYFSRRPGILLSRSIELMKMFAEALEKLRNVALEHHMKFQSEGFGQLMGMLQREVPDEYLGTLRGHLQELRFARGVLIGARLGGGNKGIGYTPLRPDQSIHSWHERLRWGRPQEFTFKIHPRDESGVNAIAELREHGVNELANTLAQAADHVLGFFLRIRAELAFYIGCMNLYQRFADMNSVICFPTPVEAGQRRHQATGLYDASLALKVGPTVVGNDLNADGKKLLIITGTNQGGKTTFLRALGIAQLMMQCGMFVTARSFCASTSERIFTHFIREEDTTMEQGKFDEELARMSNIVEHLKPNSLILFNESFAATNAREGSEIARQIVSALVEKSIRVAFVTHLYEFARSFSGREDGEILFLRAERLSNGRHSFKLSENGPLQTSFGEDLYNRIFAGSDKRAIQ